MNPMQVNKRFKILTSKIKINDILSIREYYDIACKYNYGGEYPVEEQEGYITHALVNSIRHKGIDYNKQLRALKRMDYKNYDENYKIYRNIVLNHIAEKYPFLEEECEKQKKTVEMVRKVR